MGQFSFYLFALLIAVTVASPQVFAHVKCIKMCKSTELGTPKVIDEATIEREVEIIWYPNSQYFPVTHTELVVDGTLWSGFFGYQMEGESVDRERAAKIGGRGFLSFHLKVTDSELHRIQKYLKENSGKFKLQFCVSAVCNAVTKNSGIVIPFPFSQVPTLAVAYLGLVQKLGYKRVTKIEWVGQRKLGKFLSIQPFFESWMAYAFGRLTVGFLISGFDHAHRFIETLIPVLSSMGLGQNQNLLLPTTEQTIFLRICNHTQKKCQKSLIFPMEPA
ncbi:MAG: hypothetical protein IPL83_02785 [Bdellovibrionales bacterium]|nr:hypothetical protein [Bdellovibrionales bacterium]